MVSLPRRELRGRYYVLTHHGDTEAEQFENRNPEVTSHIFFFLFDFRLFKGTGLEVSITNYVLLRAGFCSLSSLGGEGAVLRGQGMSTWELKLSTTKPQSGDGKNQKGKKQTNKKWIKKKA